MNNRSGIMLEESKNVINNLKSHYKNLGKDSIDSKRKRLVITNKVLKSAAVAVGIVAAIDIIVPDPVLGVDEAILSATTALLINAAHIVDNKIVSLDNNQDASFSIDDVSSIVGGLNNIVSKSKNNNTPSQNDFNISK